MLRGAKIGGVPETALVVQQYQMSACTGDETGELQWHWALQISALRVMLHGQEVSEAS